MFNYRTRWSPDHLLRANILIKLTRTDPSRNMHRFYALQLTATLFGEWALIAEWGRIGSAGRVQERLFAAPECLQHNLCAFARFKSHRRPLGPGLRAGRSAR
jgi:predicted DNA-binding WGR domain protein